jgi:catechol 2,3-dioxygenase-like lactoylglutathione lyase family enzyme
MSNVQGIGGAFLLAEDAAALAAWYSAHLGLSFQSYGRSHFQEFPGADLTPSDRTSSTTFGLTQVDGPLPPRPADSQINFRVSDLGGLCAALEAAGYPVERSGDHSYGRFAWVRDPEGNRIELWEPPERGT